jgi:hypothetical protein
MVGVRDAEIPATQSYAKLGFQNVFAPNRCPQLRDVSDSHHFLAIRLAACKPHHFRRLGYRGGFSVEERAAHSPEWRKEIRGRAQRLVPV